MNYKPIPSRFVEPHLRVYYLTSNDMTSRYSTNSNYLNFITLKQ